MLSDVNLIVIDYNIDFQILINDLQDNISPRL